MKERMLENASSIGSWDRPDVKQVVDDDVAPDVIFAALGKHLFVEPCPIVAIVEVIAADGSAPTNAL